MTSKAFGLAQLGNAFADGALSNRNKIINGNFDIWQRNTTFSTPGTIYTTDRWLINAGNSSTAGTQTLSRQAFSAQELGETTPEYFARFGSTGASGGTIGPQFFQRVERAGSRFFDSARSWTVSFWAKSSNVSTLRIRLAVNGTNYYADDVTLTADWQRFERTITITANDNTSRAFDELSFSLPVGVNGTVDFAQVQLEAGDTATPFEHRNFGDELARCQRYFQKSYNTDVAVGTNIQTGMSQWRNIVGNGGIYLRSTEFLRTQMRATPTYVIYSQAGVAGSFDSFDGTSRTHTVNNLDKTSARGFAGITVTGTSVPDNAEYFYHYTASAEL